MQPFTTHRPQPMPLGTTKSILAIFQI